MNFDVRPLSTHLGAEVRGIDLNDGLGDNVAGELKQIWCENGGLMVIRGQENLTTEAHIEFGAALGAGLDAITKAANGTLPPEGSAGVSSPDAEESVPVVHATLKN